MPIRNPFRRAPGVEVVEDADRKASPNPGSKPLQIKEPPEYKLSGMLITAGMLRFSLELEHELCPPHVCRMAC